MTVKVWFRPAIFLAAALLARIALAADQTPTPAQILEKKELTKSTAWYVLPAEAEILAAAKELRILKAKADVETRNRKRVEEEVARAKSAISEMEFRCKELRIQADSVSSVSAHNRLVREHNVLLLEVERANKFREEQGTRLRETSDSSRNSYATILIQAVEKIDKTAKDYEALAADADVTAAFEKLNAKGGFKLKLGPSAEYKAAATVIRKSKEEVASAKIPLKSQGNVHMLDVTLNGKVTREMILDTGASLVALPAQMAEDCGIVPTDADPTIQLQLADGRTIAGKRMVLKSVRVGIFTIENVECVVMPKSAVAAPPLLGGAYLNNFVYRLDPKAGELHLAQLPGDAKRGSAAPNTSGRSKSQSPSPKSINDK